MSGFSTGFTIFPAIDIRGGSCVRLARGDFGQERRYDADPIERAREWQRQGAEAIHVVDLDGAREGYPAQLPQIREMALAVDIPLQVGGGIRTVRDVRAVREAGASRIVLGTAAVENREFRLRALQELGDALVVAVDAREGIVATHGWQQESGMSVLDLATELASDGVSSVLFTDIARDGMGYGAALDETSEVARIIPTIASGGIREAKDVASLARFPGIIGAVVGTALYEGRVTLGELLRVAQNP